MKGEARSIGQALLDHHAAVTAKHPPGQGRFRKDRYLIAYGDLCDRAGVPWLTRRVGELLAEIAVWCADEGLPPLNSLAVNGGTRIPGGGYDGAGGFKAADWPEEVEECVRCTRYPSSMP